MEITGNIGTGIIKIALDGFSQVVAQLGVLRNAATDTAKGASTAFNNLTQSLNSVGGMFTQATSAIRGFASVADPRGALELELAFIRLQVAIGRFFIPILREAGQRVNQLAKFINSLSDDTREQVSRFTRMALAITGAAGALGTFAGIAAQVVAFLAPLARALMIAAGLFWRVLGWLGPWGRLAVIIGTVATAALGLSEAGGNLSKMFANVSNYASQAWEGLKRLWGQLVAAVEPVVNQVEGLVDGLLDFLGNVFRGFIPVLQAYGKVWSEIFNRSVQLLGKVVTAIQPLLGKIGEALTKLFSGENADAISAAFAVLAAEIEKAIPVVDRIFDSLEKGVEKAVPIIERMFDDFQRGVEAVRPLVERMAQVWGSLFSGNNAIPLAGMLEQLRPVLGLMLALAEATQTVYSALRSFGGDVFGKLVEQLDQLRPTLQRVGEVIRTVFEYAREQGKAVAEVVGGIASRVGPPLLELFSRLWVLVQRLFDLGSALASLIGNSIAKGFQQLATEVGPAIDFIGAKVQWLLDKLVEVFNAVWNPIKDGISQIARWFLWLSFRIEEYFIKAINAVLDIVNGMIEGVNNLIDKVNRLNPGKDISKVDKFGEKKTTTSVEEQTKQFTEINRITEESKKQDQQALKQQIPIVNKLVDALKPLQQQEQKPGENKFVGQLTGNARFVGIAEAMRAAQQSTVPTRETVLLEEINRQQGQANQNLQKIAENTGKEPNLGLGR